MSLKFKIRKQLLENRDKFNEFKYFEKDTIIYEKSAKLLNEIYADFKLAREDGTSNFNKFDSRIALGIYYPLKTEPDLFKFSIISDWCIALPKISNTEMDYVRYQAGSKLIKSEFGDLCEPAGDKVIVPKVVLIPGLAFDINGYRLGYGIGHYDRYFAKGNNEEIVKIGVCYDEMLMEKLPRDIHDIKMNYIITETNIYKL